MKDLKEDKVLAKTDTTGETDFEVVSNDVASKMNGSEITVQNPNGGGTKKVKVKDTGKVINEEEVGPGDYSNLARQLGKAVAAALRKHGDEVAFLSARDISDQGCTVHVQYKPDEQGDSWEDDFRFEFKQDKVILDGSEICQIEQISGTTTIQRDLVQDAITRYIDSKSSPGVNNDFTVAECGEDIGDSDLLAEFSQAVSAYRENPHDKEVLKDLIRHARGFEGDSIAQKFANAVQAYKAQGVPDGLEEPAEDSEEVVTVVDEKPVISPSDPRTEQCDGLVLDMPLLIRLLEYAKEDASSDEELHFIAEKLGRVVKEKGYASMEDYEQLISCQSPEECPEDKKTEEETD